MTFASRALRLAPIAALLAGFGTAHAMSNNTAPSNWRFDSTSTFNGVNFDGVARLYFDSDGSIDNGGFICSGTLLAGGMYVLTAGHCADNFNVMKIEFGLNNDVATATRSGLVQEIGNRMREALRAEGYPESVIDQVHVSVASDEAIHRAGGFRAFFA